MAEYPSILKDALKILFEISMHSSRTEKGLSEKKDICAFDLTVAQAIRVFCTVRKVAERLCVNFYCLIVVYGDRGGCSILLPLKYLPEWGPGHV